MKNVFARQTLPGALLGVWLVIHCCVVMSYILKTIAAGNTGYIMSWQEFIRVLFLNPNDIIKFAIYSAIIVLTGMLLSAGWFHVDKKYKYDPDNKSQNCIKWTLKVVSKPPYLIILFLLLILAITGNYINNFVLGFVIISFLVFLLLQPFSILKESVLSSETGKGWWQPAWPGLWPVVMFISIQILHLVIGYAFTQFQGVVTIKAAKVLITVPYVFESIFLAYLQSAIVLFKLTPKNMTGFIKQSFNKQVLGSMLALSVKLIYGLLFVSISVIAIGILKVFVVPTYIKAFTDHGQAIPLYLEYFLICTNFVSKFAVFLIVIPGTTIGYLLTGRLMHLLDYQNLKSLPADKAGDSVSELLKLAVLNHEPPIICPSCSSTMNKRRANNGPHAGKWFWVCTCYPQCKGLVPVPDE